jgi:FG-GAP-like repeat
MFNLFLSMLIKNRISSKNLCLIIVLCFVVTTFILNGCQQSDTGNTTITAVTDGKGLAQKYCVSCHQLPSPALIDRASWVNGVLPAMAKNLGVKTYMGQYYADKNSVINIPDWQKIVAYYENAAPVKLVIPKPSATPLHDWAIFSLLKPRIDPHGPSAVTTLLAFNEFDNKFYSGDASNNFYRWDENLKAKLIQNMTSPVTGAIFTKGTDDKEEAVITCIGEMAPKDVTKGKVIQIDLDDKEKSKKENIIGDSLPRSVQTVAADFNKDGLMDYVVCGFGHNNGGLYLLQQQANHTFKKQMIRGVPGGEQLITGDFNNDGWPDVMCLFAQADEGIWMFLNDHKGGFTTQNLLHFPAVYGSSSFQLVDFNHDGKPDILYTCGDNSDFSKVLKPYHGVYIFTNQGNWKFKQTYFYHIDGCTKAIAADFDHDGDLDIATIAFFADFKYHSSAGFTYLEQTKPNQFTPHEIPIDTYGRWLTMEVGDIDQDGNLDIMIGNFSTPGRGLLNQKDFTPKWDKVVPIIVLKNNSSKKVK